ncbi:MAG: DNA gyrase inhibitor YacG [Pirellulaceae bacterium]|nr:DNA gyrase inhibitor YacG [Pirellulaceae bacterium]
MPTTWFSAVDRGSIMALLTCPTCSRTFDAAQSAALPFCCDRCRLVDLHRWLSEQHTLPLACEDPPDDSPD